MKNAPKSSNKNNRNKELDLNQKGKVETVEEIGGCAGPEPTRYNDWERKGRCIDF